MGKYCSNIKNHKKIKKNINKTCIKFVEELICNTNFTQSFFFGKEKQMYIVILIIVAMLSSFLTLSLLCCVMVGKESDKIWEDEQIMKKENKGE